MSKQFCFKQFSIHIDPFQVIHFSISPQFSSISAIDRVLSGATTPGQMGAMAAKGCSSSSKTPASPEPYHQIVKFHTQDIR